MLTETQKTDIAELVRKILATELPAEVGNAIFNSFYDWPGDGSDQSDTVEVIEIVENEVDAYQRKGRLPPWLQ